MSENYAGSYLHYNRYIDLPVAKTSKDRVSLPVVNLDKAIQASAVIGKQVLAFGKSEKSEFINIGIFAASSGGHKGRRHIGRFTPDRERSHVW